MKLNSCSNHLTRYFLVITILLFNFSFVKGQSHTIDEGGTVNTCSADFYDDGGSGSDYTDGREDTMTFCSDNGDPISIIFSSFCDVWNYDDVFEVWDSSKAEGSAALYSSANNNNPPPDTLTSTGTCLTFVFTTVDGSPNGKGNTCSGWDAHFNCPSCSDGVKNGRETDVDCGGENCPACPNCFDGVQNQDETGVDCGGTECEPCHCKNGTQDGDETGVDCGGSCDEACPVPCNVTIDSCIPGGCCNYTLNMFDSFGDGWNGGELEVVVDGSVVGTYSVTDPPGDTVTQ
ncbi:MAG: hypothetical protein ABEH43_03720, partial [Flavobacteriales bacterium]